jgi:hypothetical protein
MTGMEYVITAIHFAIGMGALSLGLFLAGRTKRPVIRALASWPFYAVAVIFLSSAVFAILASVIVPPIAWLLSIAR